MQCKLNTMLSAIKIACNTQYAFTFSRIPSPVIDLDWILGKAVTYVISFSLPPSLPLSLSLSLAPFLSVFLSGFVFIFTLFLNDLATFSLHFC